MNYLQFFEYIFYGLLSFCALYITSTLSKLKDSVDKLNGNFATLIEKTTWHEKQLDKLEDRLNNLEHKQGI